ncbi:MAG: hypothetical protein ACD_84C00021G0002 [uncultured bacterium]|nr:MAG: hypothetical protein ACD_84C00021G0002 [uncultured bacterium]
MKYIIVFLLILTLCSCNSFNNSYTMVSVDSKNKSPKENVIIPQQLSSDKEIVNHDSENAELLKNVKCGIYILPVIRGTPPIPIAEMNALIKADDIVALSNIEKAHILELREYILELKREVHDSYHTYTDNCIKSVKKK